jgi:isocitrate/isopropylmalate dehydrogenase
VIRVAVLPGDGIGREVLEGPLAVLEGLASSGVLEVTGPWPVGATAHDALGEGLPAATLGACEEADAIFLGAVGEHPGVPIERYRPELALLELREHFDLRVSIRRVSRVGGRPLTIVRNLLGGAYGDAGTRLESDGTTAARDDLVLEPEQIAELARIACDELERSGGERLVSVDKANLFATSRLWRRVVTGVARDRGIDVRHSYVDRCAFEVAHGDDVGDVVLTEGIFGDILSDAAAGRAGSIALCSSASVHPGEPLVGRCQGLFEPVHGSAPRHAGAGRANPTGAYLALAALLEWFAETADLGRAVGAAVGRALLVGPLTYDLARPDEPVATTGELSARINGLIEDEIAVLVP